MHRKLAGWVHGPPKHEIRTYGFWLHWRRYMRAVVQYSRERAEGREE